MSPRFGVEQIVFNRKTNEKGTVRRVYESNGITRHAVAVPVLQECSSFFNYSDWNEDVLEVEQEHSPVKNRPLVGNNKTNATQAESGSTFK
jgi:hypothetical protein